MEDDDRARVSRSRFGIRHHGFGSYRCARRAAGTPSDNAGSARVRNHKARNARGRNDEAGNAAGMRPFPYC